MGIKIETDYDLKDVDGKNLVSEISFTTPDQSCHAKLNPDNSGTYIYESTLIGDDTAIMAPEPMTLADVVLAANVHLGLIPPQNFDSIPCDNEH